MIPDDARSHQPVPNKQNNQRAKGSADESGALIHPVETCGLADKSGQQGASNAHERRDEKSPRLVRSGRKQASDDAGDKPDNDNPEENTHLPIVSKGARCGQPNAALLGWAIRAVKAAAVGRGWAGISTLPEHCMAPRRLRTSPDATSLSMIAAKHPNVEQ